MKTAPRQQPRVTPPERFVCYDDPRRFDGPHGGLRHALHPTLRATNPYTLILDGGRLRNPTPTEYERLQGLADNWTASQPRSTRYLLIGDAVCAPLFGWIGARL